MPVFAVYMFLHHTLFSMPGLLLHVAERTGVSNQIKDVLTKIIENRPEDPISFLAD